VDKILTAPFAGMAQLMVHKVETQLGLCGRKGRGCDCKGGCRNECDVKIVQVPAARKN
jgi:hypothetical protein